MKTEKAELKKFFAARAEYCVNLISSKLQEGYGDDFTKWDIVDILDKQQRRLRLAQDYFSHYVAMLALADDRDFVKATNKVWDSIDAEVKQNMLANEIPDIPIV